MSQSYIPAELRRLVRQRAANCCEYCLLPESLSFMPHELDHITAEKHGGATDETNLALACLFCNKHKGTDLASIDPITGAVELLFHPRLHRWAEHFRLVAGRIEPMTAIGRVTVKLLCFNQPARVEERIIMVVAGPIVAAK